MKAMLLSLLCTALIAGAAAVQAEPSSPRLRAPDPGRIERGPVFLSVVDRDSGQELTRHLHQGQRWVAGEQGHRYAVRLRNRSSERVLVVLSVDGINAISGEQAAPDQTGYVLSPGQSTDITGWRKSNDEVAQFVFSRPGDSYASRTGRGADVGVMGIAVFNERDAVRWEHRPASPLSHPAPASRGATRQVAEAASDAAAAPAQRLGTGHGDREASSVRDTAFERATTEPVQISELRYDSARNLRARGIDLAPRPLPRQPQAFPQRFVPDPPAR